MLGIIFVLAIFGALAAIAKTSKEKKMARKNFVKINIFYWSPLIALVIVDLWNLGVQNQPKVHLESASLYISVYLLFTSYPLFQRVCWRLNDAGKGRFLGYIALIPYLNVLVFAYLCLIPSRKPGDM